MASTPACGIRVKSLEVRLQSFILMSGIVKIKQDLMLGLAA